MSQYNELEQALKVADNPALGSTPERILAAEVRRLQAVNQTINAIWGEVDAYARNHSEIQLGESVSGHALKLMRERDELKAELARLREQKPLTWGTSGELMDILKNPIYSSPAPAPAVAAPTVLEEWRKVMAELADDLAIEIDQNYPPERRAYPSEQRKYEGEMAPVYRARALLQSSGDPK